MLGFAAAIADGASDLDVQDVIPDRTSFEFSVIDNLEGDTELLSASIDAEIVVDAFMDKADY